MSKVEFVDREKAEAEAARAIGLLNQSDEAKVEAWFAMQVVADQVGAESNTGVAGISWKRPRPGRKAAYTVSATQDDGERIVKTVAAPQSPEEVRSSPLLQMAITQLEAIGSRPTFRPKGTSAALLAAVGATPEGVKWIADRKYANQVLLEMVRIADAYGRHGVYPQAGINAHVQFIPFAERAALIRQFPSSNAARMKVARLRGVDADNKFANTPSLPHIPLSVVKRLERSSGAGRYESRAVLKAVIAGRSERVLLRLVREAVKMARVANESAPASCEDRGHGASHTERDSHEGEHSSRAKPQ